MPIPWLRRQTRSVSLPRVTQLVEVKFKAVTGREDTQSQNSGYVLGTPVCNTGPYVESCCGAIQVTVFFNPN
jgi:hypothetical protein